MTKMRSGAIAIATVASLLFLAAPMASAKDCDMTYSLKGWSAVYKTAKGEGTITCNSGETALMRRSVSMPPNSRISSMIGLGKKTVAAIRRP